MHSDLMYSFTNMQIDHQPIIRFGFELLIPFLGNDIMLKGQYRHDQQGMESEC